MYLFKLMIVFLLLLSMHNCKLVFLSILILGFGDWTLEQPIVVVDESMVASHDI